MLTSDSIVSLANEPLYYDWSWDPLDMPAVTLKNPGHVNFMLNNLRKYLAKVKEHSEDATVIDDLLISTAISPKSKISKFAVFFWITTIFISCSILVKMYSTSKCMAPSILSLFIQ
jgi:hypothetical protein